MDKEGEENLNEHSLRYKRKNTEHADLVVLKDHIHKQDTEETQQ